MEDKYKILIVDDTPQNIQLAASILKADDIQISFARNGINALEYVKNNNYDLILLDVMMPEVSGFEVCERIKNDELTKDIAVIFLTAKTEMDSLVKGFNLGAADYVTKPFNSQELISRVRTHLELSAGRKKIVSMNEILMEKNEALIEYANAVETANQELTKALEKIEKLSKEDGLTGLYNRRAMNEFFNEEIVRYKRNNREFSVVIADIDFFKTINDTFGHNFGDDVLKEVANIFRTQVREQDKVGRWGGEEFVILMPETNVEGARILAERVRSGVERLVLDNSGKEVRITITLGVAEFGNYKSIKDLIDEADRALYKGKETGRNKVI